MKILVGYDGSNVAKAALNLATKHAAAFDGKVYVVTSLVGHTETSMEEYREAEQKLDYVKELLQDSGIPFETHLLVQGRTPAEDLVAFAEDHQMDEIVMGVRKRSAVGKLIFGSNARFVILNAPCPVVTVK